MIESNNRNRKSNKTFKKISKLKIIKNIKLAIMKITILKFNINKSINKWMKN